MNTKTIKVGYLRALWRFDVDGARRREFVYWGVARQIEQFHRGR